MARGRAAAVVALLVLAGCQGFDSGGETVTPAPVPTANDEVVGDANVLADRHRRALDNRSYTMTVALTVEYANGTTARLTDVFAVGRDGAYRYDRRLYGPYPAPLSNFTIWQTRSTEYRRATAANGTTTVAVSESDGFDDITFSGFLRRLLLRFDLTTAQDNGRTLVGGHQTGQLTVPLATDLRDGHNGTLDGEIRDGIVRSTTVRARADYPDIDQSVSVRLRFTVQRVGETDPTRPPWAAESSAGG